jgi:cell division protein FtsL
MISVTRAAERFIHTNFLARQKVSRDTDEGGKDFFYMICMGALIMTAFFMFLWVRIYFLEIGYQISGAHRTYEELLQESKKLKVERAALNAPSRLELIAVHKLGMKLPHNNQVVILPW